jgi:hypothetical protein
MKARPISWWRIQVHASCRDIPCSGMILTNA